MALLDTKPNAFFCFEKMLSFLLFFTAFTTLSAQVVYVDAGSPCVSGCGDSWANAYPDLKDALLETDEGEIWVAKGTYRPAECPGTCQNIDRLETFQLKNNVAVYGGFFGNETALDQRDPVVNETFLSGNIGFGVAQNDNSFHIVTATNVDSTAILDGFIIRDGLADGTFGTNNERGSGVYITATNGEESSPVIRNCVFTQNTAIAGGGAVFVSVESGSTASPLFEDCLFNENRSEGLSSGGAAAHNVVDGGNLAPTYLNCRFEGNETGDNGGAIAFFASNFGTVSRPVIDSCSFSDNNATNWGGAIYTRVLDNASFQANIVRTTFLRNEAGDAGGAVYDHAGFGAVSTTRVLNSTFTENAGVNDGGAIYLRGSQMANNFSLVFNCIFNTNAALQGGAIFTSSAVNGVDLGVCRPEITNCTFYNNQADATGSALFNEFSNTEIYNAILWDNDEEIGNDNANPIIQDCIIKGGYNGSGTSANILDTDPFFLFPDRGDFHLSHCSPAIDIGEAANIPIDSTDLDGDNTTTETIDVDADAVGRTFGASVDLGAYEWSGTPGENEVIFVKLDATGSNDGTSWDNAFTDLQSALDAAYPCSDIWVATGVYYPVECAGPCTEVIRAVSFRMKSQVGIYGGFNGTESTFEERDVVGNETILSGNIGDINDREDNSFHVVLAEQVDSTGILDGFTIQDGNANGTLQVEFSQGGGLYIDAVSGLANPSIRNCNFNNNQARESGGAVHVDASQNGTYNSIFENCSFSENFAGVDGGAIFHTANGGGTLEPVYQNCNFLDNGSQINGGAVIQYADGTGTLARIQYLDCNFESNNAEEDGGAILGIASNNATQRIVIQNTVFLNNNAGGSGGAVYDEANSGGSSEARIVNVSFRENEVVENGGALYLRAIQSGTNRATLFNVLFDENRAQIFGGGIYNAGAEFETNLGNCEPIFINLTFSNNGALSGLSIYNNFANPEINNCILWNGGDEIVDIQSAPIVQNSIIQGGYSGDGFFTNIIDEDPLFLNEAERDFRLVSCSPGIDQGLTGIIPFDLTDVDADDDNLEQIDVDLLESLRLFGDQIDLGAFEWNGFPEVISLDVQKVDVSCFGFCDGNVSIDPSGGTGNFTISWTDGLGGV